MLCNYAPPPHHDPSLGTYSTVGEGGGGLQTNPPPPQYLYTRHTTQLHEYLHSCKEASPPLLLTTTRNNTTTLHNKTRVHKITNVPVFYMALKT
jgi:hypothetical protein